MSVGHLNSVRRKLWFEPQIAKAEKWAKAVLENKDSDKALARLSKNYQQRGNRGERSLLWYAEQILSHIGTVRHAIDEDDAVQTAYHALILGRLLAQIGAKIELEDHAERSKEYSKTQSNTGKKRKGMRHADYIEMAKEFLKRQPTSRLSDTDLKEWIGARPRFGLKRTQSITGIDRGLTLLVKEVSTTLKSG